MTPGNRPRVGCRAIDACCLLDIHVRRANADNVSATARRRCSAHQWPAPFLVLGNYFGNLKPNRFVGIRTPWTLKSDETWRATHRLGGRISGLWLTCDVVRAIFRAEHHAPGDRRSDTLLQRGPSLLVEVFRAGLPWSRDSRTPIHRQDGTKLFPASKYDQHRSAEHQDGPGRGLGHGGGEGVAAEAVGLEAVPCAFVDGVVRVKMVHSVAPSARCQRVRAPGLAMEPTL